MKIESIKISQVQTAPLGLEEINLSKLGQIVLVAGRNGSGKTRFLSLIPKEFARLQQLRHNIPSKEHNIKRYKQELENFERQLLQLKSELEFTQNIFLRKDFKRKIERCEQDIQVYLKAIQDEKVSIDSTSNVQFTGNGGFFYYVPKQLVLKDSNDLTKSDLLKSAGLVQRSGIDNLPAGTLAAIQVAQNRFYSTSHQRSSASQEEIVEAELNYNRLKIYIGEFLGTTLGRDSDDNATLFGKSLGQASLSDGQLILLQLCVALYAQEASLPDLILILDEPENHLHPAALNYVLDRLQKIVTRGQIWIATHSINVLAHFDNPTIYYMEDGKLSYAGDIPEKVLAGLLGNEEEREKLANFLALPFEMSSTRFAYESLLGPAVVMTSGKDPQLQQIQWALRQAHDEQGKVRVLDFGAGRGRLIATIEDMEQAGTELRPAAWLDYVAYDPYPTNAAECKANIERVYGQATNRYFSDLEPLRMQYHDGSFDIVLLTNVFHEIPPQKWNKVISDIERLLKPEGFLLIVEDQRLPHGEKAHDYGFLLFDKLEFRKLFAINAQHEASGLYAVKEEKEGRLKAHYFKRELLARMTAETKMQALRELRANAKDRISQIREQEEPSFKNGKIHAFWMNQFANAQLALAELE